MSDTYMVAPPHDSSAEQQVPGEPEGPMVIPVVVCSTAVLVVHVVAVWLHNVARNVTARQLTGYWNKQ